MSNEKSLIKIFSLKWMLVSYCLLMIWDLFVGITRFYNPIELMNYAMIDFTIWFIPSIAFGILMGAYEIAKEIAEDEE